MDLKILDIIGQDSPLIDAIVENDVPETGNQTQELINQVVPHFADVQNIPQASSIVNLRGSSNRKLRVPKINLKTDRDDYLTQKKKLTLELLSHDIYLRKLQALKLEKELGVRRSEYTQDLEEIKGIKTENMCEMEFEY